MLRNYECFSDAGRAEVNDLFAKLATKRTVHVWAHREQLRKIIERKQINVAADMPWRWCTIVTHARVEHVKTVARLIRNHFKEFIARMQTHQPNVYLKVLNGCSSPLYARCTATAETPRSVP